MIVTCAPLAIETSLHVIGWLVVHEPLVLWIESTLTPAENASVTVGLDAVAGP